MAVLEKKTEKNLCRAESLLSFIVSDLAKDGLDKCEVISSETKKDINMVYVMLKNAKLPIKGIQRNEFNL